MLLKDIEELAKDSEDIYILGHMNPDGDCVGATLALAMLLNKKGIRANVLLKDVPSTYHFLPLGKWIVDKEPTKVDLLISLDCGDVTRFGEFQKCIDKAKTIINIDHHFSNTNFGKYNYVVSAASSTCEIIYDMIDDKSLVDVDIATALYTGIVYDTGIFKHSCTTQNTHNIAGSLITYGVDFTEIISKLFFYKSLTGLRAQSKAIENLQMFSLDKIALTYLTRNEIQSLNATKKHTESIVQMLNEIENIECSVFIYETDLHEHKVSLRSKGAVNVCEVAQYFGGGGHKNASGFCLEGHLSTVMQKIISVINEQLVMSS
ncbi:MAG: hypothetical protein CVU84_04530 [Firmicutes bacterium HGW-Firmicutes-1]|jgi:phosphoesterase RecJ-like protein|nr:MAG: hypothetical protein CVU84_04530 [Firmicutes bacterium HGW-Firmicutes-1]